MGSPQAKVSFNENFRKLPAMSRCIIGTSARGLADFDWAPLLNVYGGRSPGPETPRLIAGVRRERSNLVCNVSRLLTGLRLDENLSSTMCASF
jgi:hypothetical protein